MPQDLPGLFGQEVCGQSNFWLAVDANQYPALLFPSDRLDKRSDIELRSVEALFCRECSITIGFEDSITGSFSIVRLKENDPDLIRAFLRLLEETFCRDKRHFSSREIAEKILELASLFKRIENSRRDILGLWGELFAISRAKNVQEAAKCWSASERAKFDFVAGDFALDVKTTIRPARTHRFSIDQLRPKDGVEVYIASLRVAQTLSGQSVGDIMEEIEREITEADISKQFFSICLLKGGEGIYRDTTRYQAIPGGNALSYFSAESLPVPKIEDETSISNVRFDLCLDHQDPVSDPDTIRRLEFKID